MKLVHKIGVLALAMGMAVSVHAADPKAAAPAKDPKAEMMAQMMKIGSPSDNHKLLEPMVGNWEYVGKASMDPSQPTQEFKGASASEWILGGRFVKQTVKGQMMGMPFEGMGLIGYDNMKGEYVTIWIDNMSTTMMKGSSQYDAATKTFAEAGTFACPMTNVKDQKYRSVMKMVDADHMTYEMYSAGTDGKEVKGMEITYSRVKPAAPAKAQ